jgi:Undecaprenyl-phosphate glucose phosphotransferase
MTADTRWANMTLRELRAARAPSAPEGGPLNDAAAVMARELRRPAVAPGRVSGAVAVVDLALLAVAAWFGQFAALGGAADAGALTARAAALACLAVSGLALARAYRLAALARFAPSWARAMALVAVAGGAMLALGVWPSRGGAAFGAAAFACALVLTPLRLAEAAIAGWLIEAGVTERRAVVVGGGGAAEALIRALDARPDGDIRIVGIFDDRDDLRSPPVVAGRRKLGTIPELLEFARIAHVDMLIVTLPLSAEDRILTLLKSLWVLPVDIRLSAYSQDFAFPRRDAAGEPRMIDVLRNPLADSARLLKRGFDLTVASLALAVLSPVMLAAALAIRLDSPGPVFFRQSRHGYNHRPIMVWKFRSMRHESADPDARRIVTRDDDRVTRVGRFIRKTSVDELPQLFNVLAGELSLVGPRPHAVTGMSSRQQLFSEIVEGYSGRHKVPPGITGWAQVNGWRGEIDDPEKLRQRFEHDLYYIENWSIWLDLKILAMTPLKLLDTRHAY